MEKLEMVLLTIIFLQLIAIFILSYGISTGSNFFKLVDQYISNFKKTSFNSCIDCNVILVSIDTLRADHLGIYGYGRNTSPNIDKFFKDGIVFKNAFVQAPITLPSHMSMFTGLYPSHHKIIDFDENISLSSDKKTLAEILKIYGYKTGGFYSGGNHLNPKFGFSRGFEKYIANDFVVNPTELFKFLNSSKKNKFFIFMHTSQVHDPYLSISPYDTMFDKGYNGRIVGNREEFRILRIKNNISGDYNKIRAFYWSNVNKSDIRDITHLVALYDGNINRVDSFLGDFFNYLELLDILNKTVIIITSDHGEEFNEHGGFLHERFYEETIHDPLLIYIPNFKPKIIKNQVGSIDITPTVLSILGLPQPQHIDGRSLTFLIENPNAPDPNQMIYSEFISEWAVRTPKWKLIMNKNGAIELYDIENDPKEQVNVAERYPDIVKNMKNKLDAFKLSRYSKE